MACSVPDPSVFIDEFARADRCLDPMHLALCGKIIQFLTSFALQFFSCSHIPFWHSYTTRSPHHFPCSFAHLYNFPSLSSVFIWGYGFLVLDSVPLSNYTSRPRTRGAGSSSRPSTSTSRPEHDNTIPLREPTAFRTLNDRPASWRHPDRHVLIIVNFQDLADLSSRTQQLPDNADRLDAECRIHLDAIDEVSLFTWCRHFDHREVIQTPIGNLCNLISTRIRDTWDIRIPGTTLELRASDYWGETVQLAADKTIAETLDTWVPRWREFQYTSTSWEALPRYPRRPFTWHLSCHRHIPSSHFALTIVPQSEEKRRF